uniref:Fibroblast growth factor 6 n=1 Tax=Aquila chrysaetos chrysaetos TaxID=223781 RepID=A0A663EGU9_AQUCH
MRSITVFTPSSLNKEAACEASDCPTNLTPLLSRANETPLLPPVLGDSIHQTSARWQSLLSRSIAGMSGEKSDVNWESDYLLGIKRQRRLYCNVGIGFHLQILPDGRISGVHNENQYSELHPEMK